MFFLVLANNLYILLRSSCVCFFSSPKATQNQQICEFICLTCAFISGQSPINMFPQTGIGAFEFFMPQKNNKMLASQKSLESGFSSCQYIKNRMEKTKQNNKPSLFCPWNLPERATSWKEERYFSRNWQQACVTCYKDLMHFNP